MAVPSFESITEATNVWDGSSPYGEDISMPATRPDNDLYFFLLVRDDDTAELIEDSAITQIYEAGGSTGGSLRWFLGYRIGSSEPASYAFTSTAAGALERGHEAVIRISGIDTSDPIGSIAVAESIDDTGTTAIAPDITVEQGDSLILRLYVVDTDAISSIAAGPTEIFKSNNNEGGDTNSAAAYEDGPSSGATGTHNATLDAADDWAAFTIEIRSATPPSSAGGYTGSLVMMGFGN